jgi:integrating conjugative element protein (TIGR03749 family)
MKTGVQLLAGCVGLWGLWGLSAGADELMKWERIPLQIPLSLAHERVVFVDKNVRVGFPPALNGKLRVQSTGGAVYLKAEATFPTTRLQLQDVESGEVILLDVTASETGPSEPVRLIYRGDVTTLSRENDVPLRGASGRASDRMSGETAPASKATTRPETWDDNVPLPVALTRYAAQSLFAPLRTVDAVAGIHPLNLHLPGRLTTLYPSAPLTVTPLVAWGMGRRAVVALLIRNAQRRTITLDPRALQGEFVAATFQHGWLGPAGTPEDTTVLYLVTAGRPERAFIAERETPHVRGTKGGKS